MRSSRLLLPLATVAVLVSTPVASAAPAPAPAPAPPAAPSARAAHPRYAEYVSLGDSWSADVVVANADGAPDSTYAPVDCAQSHHNYPKIVAAAIGVRRFRDATCGSAT